MVLWSSRSYPPSRDDTSMLSERARHLCRLSEGEFSLLSVSPLSPRESRYFCLNHEHYMEAGLWFSDVKLLFSCILMFAAVPRVVVAVCWFLVTSF